jgi:hypothetical protein
MHYAPRLNFELILEIPTNSEIRVLFNPMNTHQVGITPTRLVIRFDVMLDNPPPARSSPSSFSCVRPTVQRINHAQVCIQNATLSAPASPNSVFKYQYKFTYIGVSQSNSNEYDAGLNFG